MTLNEKVDYKTVIECVKELNIFIGLKKTCLGILDREERKNDNGTGLKEGGVIEIETTVLHYAMLAPSLFSTTVLQLRDAPLSFTFFFTYQNRDKM